MQEKRFRRLRMMPDSETMSTATTAPNELSDLSVPLLPPAGMARGRPQWTMSHQQSRFGSPTEVGIWKCENTSRFQRVLHDGPHARKDAEDYERARLMQS